MRIHIREQIDVRIRSMDKVCYESGSCKMCGCHTTALQMANKPCDKPCYPSMMTRKKWKMLKNSVCLKIDSRYWIIQNGKFKINEHI
jgi:hypothetical protein